MGYKIVELEDDSEFEELCRVGRESYETPHQAIWELFFPMFGSDEAARTATTKEAAERLARWQHADPTGHWLKVVDEETGNLLGATLWHIYEENPYAAEDDHGCDWFPVGEERDIANALLERFSTPKMKYMPRPHVYLNIAFTAPDARNQGVMSMLIEWGLKEADKRGFASYLDAFPMGLPLYKKFGFIPHEKHELSIGSFSSPSEIEKEMEKRVLPIAWWPMYRPPYGTYVDGVTVLPWDESL